MLKNYGFRKVDSKVWILEDYESDTFIEIIGNNIRIDSSGIGGKCILYVICDNIKEVNKIIKTYLEEGELPNNTIVVID